MFSKEYLAKLGQQTGFRFESLQKQMILQVLEVLRQLCLEKKEAYAELCRLLDDETRQSRNMQKYDALLSKSVRFIAGTFRTRSARNLSTSRDAMLIPEEQQPQAPADFELVTWIVVRSL